MISTYNTDDDVVTITIDNTSMNFKYYTEDDHLNLWQPITDITITDSMCMDETNYETDLMNTHDIYIYIDPKNE